jgi:hypothetical protein
LYCVASLASGTERPRSASIIGTPSNHPNPKAVVFKIARILVQSKNSAELSLKVDCCGRKLFRSEERFSRVCDCKKGDFRLGRNVQNCLSRGGNNLSHSSIYRPVTSGRARPLLRTEVGIPTQLAPRLFH